MWIQPSWDECTANSEIHSENHWMFRRRNVRITRAKFNMMSTSDAWLLCSTRAKSKTSYLTSPMDIQASGWTTSFCCAPNSSPRFLRLKYCTRSYSLHNQDDAKCHRWVLWAFSLCSVTPHVKDNSAAPWETTTALHPAQFILLLRVLHCSAVFVIHLCCHLFLRDPWLAN